MESILTRHWKPDLQVLLENVAMDGSPMFDLTEGRMIHPGHAIESAWMLMEIALGTTNTIELPADYMPTNYRVQRFLTQTAIICTGDRMRRRIPMMP